MRVFSLTLLLCCLVAETAYIIAPYSAPAALAPVEIVKKQDRIQQDVVVVADYPPVLDMTLDIPQGVVEEENLVPQTVPYENILKRYRRHQAEIVEPARPGMVWVKTASGVKAIVAERYAKAFVGFLQDLEGTGYKIKDVGGYAYRRIAGRRVLSKHAFGAAIDVNQEERNIVSVHMNNQLVSRLASKHGLCSGGDWQRSPDLGHFEVCGRPERVGVQYAKTEKLSKRRSVRVAHYRHRYYVHQRTADASVGYHDIGTYH